MGILTPALAVGRAPWDDYWYEPRGPRSAAGLEVSMDTALTVPSFYAGVAYISEDIAKLPLNMYEDLGAKGHRPAPGHYLQRKLHDQPNRYQIALEFREMMTAFAMLRPFAIAEKRRISGRRPVVDDELIPLHPDLVRERVLDDGSRTYVYRDPRQQLTERTLLEDEVFLIRGRLGKSLVDVLRDAIGLAQAQERHVGNLFSRGAKPGGVVLRDKPWSDPDRRNFRRALNEYAVAGQYSGRPLLLEDGMRWQDVGMNAKDAELVDSRRFSVIEFCRGLRIPPHKLFELERSTNNNIERQSVDYVVDSLLGWTERWEQVIWRDLIVDRDRARFFAEHNLDGLMRGDIAARFTAYALAVQWGWMTRNEIRAKENMNPITGADSLERPLNMEPVGGAGASNVVALRVRLKLHASSAAARVVRREMSGVEKLLDKTDPAGRTAALTAFYAEHAEEVARQLHVAEHEATAYAAAHRDAILDQGPVVMTDWLTTAAAQLTDLAMDQKELAA